MKLRPYPEYKDSGVPWLGEAPTHWQLRRIKSLSPVLRGASPRPIDDPVYFDEKGEYSWVRISDVTNSNKYLLKTTQRLSPLGKSKSVPLEPGSIFLSIAGSVGKPIIAKIRCCIHDGFVYFPKFGESVDFLYYLFSSGYLWEGLGKHGTQLNLNTDTVGSIRVGWPPLAEQTQVARFLDWKTAQIDRFIRNKRRLIELLKEQKQALINQAVTGQIDVRTGKPYPEYKDSGVPWLGKVPVGWEILPIKRVARFNPSKSETGDSPSVNKQVCFLPMERISEEGEIDCSEKRQLSEVWEGFTYFRRGDVVLAKITPCFENGKGAYLSELETEYGFGTTELFVLRPTQKIHGSFLRFVTATKTFRWLGAQNMTGAAGQQRVPSSFVKNFQIGLPPLDEQEAIVSFIQRISKSIDTAITRTQREIELIQEYRTRLIADVVTGKLDVRDVEVPEVDELEEAVGEGVITGDAVAQDNLEVAM